MCTIPPRQQLSSPTRLVLRRRDVIYGSRTLALINLKACTTTHTRKREKRAFLTFFEKTLPSSHFNSSLTFPRTHAHIIFDRSIDSSKPKSTEARGFPRKRSQPCLRAKPTRYSFRYYLSCARFKFVQIRSFPRELYITFDARTTR